jgi:hypothetical protein
MHSVVVPVSLLGLGYPGVLCDEMLGERVHTMMVNVVVNGHGQTDEQTTCRAGGPARVQKSTASWHLRMIHKLFHVDFLRNIGTTV